MALSLYLFIFRCGTTTLKPSCLDPGRREKINFYFYTFFVVPQKRFYEGLKSNGVEQVISGRVCLRLPYKVIIFKSAFTCSESTMVTSEQCVKSVQS